ncbi:MAG: hypothetical protein ACRCZI_01805, partial [Cetobacterium sp.]
MSLKQRGGPARKDVTVVAAVRDGRVGWVEAVEDGVETFYDAAQWEESEVAVYDDVTVGVRWNETTSQLWY